MQRAKEVLAARVHRHLRAAYRKGRRVAGRLRQRGRLQPLLVGAGAAAVLLVVAAFLILRVPASGRLEDARLDEATIAYTADGRELTRYHVQNRTWVDLDEVSPHVVEALVATEDHRFYDHHGIDVRRVFGAVWSTARGEREGGSTITMQLARNLFPELRDDGLLVRKLKEWLWAVRLESHYSKDDILEMYLNVVPFLYDAVGIETAARTYFQKPAAELGVLEAATLVGMLKATAYYNPVRHPERARTRRNVVLHQMAKRGYLTPARLAALVEEPTPLDFHRVTRDDNRAPFFAEYVRQWLETWAEEHGYNLYTDGLRVYTTLDARLQEAAEAAVEQVGHDMQTVAGVSWSRPAPFFSRNRAAYRAAAEDAAPFAHFWATHPDFLDEVLSQTLRFRRLAETLPPDSALARLRRDAAFVDSVRQVHERLEASFVAIDPRTGHVRAWVGGRRFAEREFDHVARSHRQPGSTFKPFVYAAALENGFAPYSRVPDVVRTYHDPYAEADWTPGNFGSASGRLLTLRQGLALSKNTVTARLITTIGPDEVVDVARRAGIRSPLQAVPSLGLGTSEVSLLELTSAYTTLAGRGLHHEPVLVTRIEDRHGETLATFGEEARRALPEHTAYAVLDMMRGVVDFGTGVRIRSQYDAEGDLAGKTGTTQHGADGWFMLAHPDLVMGAWMGFATPKMAFRTQFWGQGAHNALHVVGTFYRQARTLGALDPDAAFEGSLDHEWGNRTISTTDADALNRRERRSSKVDEYLRRLRRR